MGKQTGAGKVMVVTTGSSNICQKLCLNKSKSNPWTGPEGSRRLRLPDLKHSAHESGKVFSPMHWPPLLPRNIPGAHFC